MKNKQTLRNAIIAMVLGLTFTSMGHAQILTNNPAFSGYFSNPTGQQYSSGVIYAQVTLGNLSQNYDGTTKSVSVTTAPTNLTVTLTYNGSTNLPVNAGSYPVVGTVVSTNYSGVGTNTLTIAKASNAITFPAVSGGAVGGSATLTATASSGLPVSYSPIVAIFLL